MVTKGAPALPDSARDHNLRLTIPGYSHFISSIAREGGSKHAGRRGAEAGGRGSQELVRGAQGLDLGAV